MSALQGGCPRATQLTRSQIHAGRSADGTLGAAWTTRHWTLRGCASCFHPTSLTPMEGPPAPTSHSRHVPLGAAITAERLLLEDDSPGSPRIPSDWWEEGPRPHFPSSP